MLTRSYPFLERNYTSMPFKFLKRFVKLILFSLLLSHFKKFQVSSTGSLLLMK
jgi:hypothetical protein